MTLFYTESYSQNNEIIVDISEQRLYLYNNDNLVQSFPVSTSKYGEGQIENSFKTPLGLHEIKEKHHYKATNEDLSNFFHIILKKELKIL